MRTWEYSLYEGKKLYAVLSAFITMPLEFSNGRGTKPQELGVTLGIPSPLPRLMPWGLLLALSRSKKTLIVQENSQTVFQDYTELIA
ncbi:MAG: hypothetical protein IKJ26_01750 [Clostridia bacterium]|nr:hypothetical protein [Clostridia bacterium]